MAWLSLAVACCAGLIVVIVWVSSREQTTPTPPRRMLSDMVLEWMCVQEPTHRFKASGRVEPRVCEVCGAEAYIVLPYRCPVHGEFEALVQFKRELFPGADGSETVREVPDKYSYDGRTWYQFDTWVRCPKEGCDESTERVLRIWKSKPKKSNRK